MIRVGIGGWTYEPWRGGETFYPKGLAQAKELAYASSKLTSIEINGTYYSTQKPTSFRKWFSETPDDFVFSVKGPRYAVNRKELAGAKDSIDRFFGSGIEELGPKLGPVLWQLAPTKKYDPADLGAFFDLMPRKLGSLKIRHVLEPRHPSFVCEDYVKQARAANIGTVFADHEKYPAIPDPTADFVYARLQQSQAEVKTGYKPADLKKWAARAQAWASGATPSDLKAAGPAAPKAKRDVFIYMISGAKERAPAAAQALIELLGD